MNLMKICVLLTLVMSGASAFAADDLDPALQRQLALLEARANANGPAGLAVANAEPTQFSNAKFSNTSDKISESKLFPAESSTPVAQAAGGNAPPVAGAAPTSILGAPATAVDASGAAMLPGKAAEAEIPVLTKFNKKVETDSIGTPSRLLATFGIVIGVLIGSIFFLKKYTAGKTGKAKHTQIQVTAQHHLGPKKSIAIIRVAGESMLIGITDHSISMIKQLHILDEDMAEEEITEDFRDRLVRSTQDQAPRPALPTKQPRAQVAPAPGAALQVKARPAAPAVASAPVKRPGVNARQVYESYAQDELNDSEEFMMRGIRDIVSDRLRNRKTLV